MQKIKKLLAKIPFFYAQSIKNVSQLNHTLQLAARNNIIDAQSMRMIEGVLASTTMQVRDIMIPRSQMVCLDISQTPQECVNSIQKAKHSRYPVIGKSKDDILGILLAKDMLTFINQESNLQIKDLYHKPLFTPESRKIIELMKDFQVQHYHMAIVADEYGGVAGLVTIEDIIEQIVGDIEDEFYQEDNNTVQKVNNSYIIKGNTLIEDLNKYDSFNIPIQNFDTINGLISNAFGYIPKKGKTIKLHNFQWKIMQRDDRSIILLEATKLS